jgi:hypothetical protein
MRVWTTGLAISALVCQLASCSSSSTPPPDGTVDEFCADWAKALCQVPCNFDVMACVTFQTSACQSFVASLQQSGSTRQYSQPNGKACIDALNSAYGGGVTMVSAATLAMTSATCNRVVVGSQATNKACTDDNDCANGLVCTPYNGGKLCGPLTARNVGDPCGDPGDSCQGDSYCAAQAGAAPQCVATPATGGACSATIPCGSSNRCVGGTCQARATSGQACSSNSDCASSAPYCDTYPPAACTTGLSFARGSIDCNGILGTDEPGSAGNDAGAGNTDAAPEGAAQAEASVDSPTE